MVIPDIHARMGFVRRILDMPVPDPAAPDDPQQVAPLIERLRSGGAQLVFVGDYVHAEQRAADRWRAAMKEFLEGFKQHASMDAEMRESLGTLEILARIKLAFPEAVHLLKGNHENIRNSEEHGNHPFGKFAYEGQMVVDYMQRFFPGEVLDAIDSFERSLPLLAVGADFLVSHAEPKRVYAPAEVRDFREHPEVIEGLTWTANDEAEDGSVAGMLATYLGADRDREHPYYFGGHRPVTGRYGVRADGRYIQLHNPAAEIAAVIPAEQSFDPEEHILYI